MSHSIDTYSFDWLDGVVPVRRSTGRMIERDGVGNWGRRRLGLQSPEFELRSRVYVADYDACRARYKLYAQLIDQSPTPPLDHEYVLVKDGYNFQTAEDVNVVVLDVRPALESQISVVRTGFALQNPGTNFVCEAIWRLRFRPVQPPP